MLSSPSEPSSFPSKIAVSIILLSAPHLFSIVSRTLGSRHMFWQSWPPLTTSQTPRSLRKPSRTPKQNLLHQHSLSLTVIFLEIPHSQSLEASCIFRIVRRSSCTASASSSFRLCPRAPPPWILCLSPFHPHQQD